MRQAPWGRAEGGGTGSRRPKCPLEEQAGGDVAWSSGRAGISRREGHTFSWLHSLRVLPEKLSLATTAPKKPPAKRTRWNILKCAYMMVTFLFVSYNKGDWVRRSPLPKGVGEGEQEEGGREELPSK